VRHAWNGNKLEIYNSDTVAVSDMEGNWNIVVTIVETYKTSTDLEIVSKSRGGRGEASEFAYIENRRLKKR